MAQYTVEDIEILRQKSGISYEEAVNLLEYHNGSLARSLVDLEKNGRIRDAKTTARTYVYHSSGHHLFEKLFRTRFKVFKGEVPVANISLLFTLFSLLVAPWLVIIGAVVALALGYRFSFERNSNAFANESLDSIVKNAGSNVKNTVFTLTREFASKPQAANAPGNEATTAAPEPEMRSESPASGTKPVNVQFSEDGNVRVTENRDGFHEAEIQ